MAALALAVELLIRAAAVYVVVLMLPLAFAAMVWPARRVWAARMVELLVSLILSKFVIVAVLSLAAAHSHGGHAGISELLVAMSLILLSTFAPWALMRILPFTELAAGAAGIIGSELSARRATLAADGHVNAAGRASVAMELPLAAARPGPPDEAGRRRLKRSGAPLAGRRRLTQRRRPGRSPPIQSAPQPTAVRIGPQPAEPTAAGVGTRFEPHHDAAPASPAEDERPPFVLAGRLAARRSRCRLGPELRRRRARSTGARQHRGSK